MRRELCFGLATVLMLAACLTPAICPAVAGEHWTSYRGPADQGHTDAERLPIQWSEDQNVVWKAPIEGKAWSTPVIWGDRIWLTNARSDGSRYSVLCLDKNSGKPLLPNKVLYSVALPQYCHPLNSYASPSPVIEEGHVYVSFGSPYNACLNCETGEVVWERTDFVCNHFRGPASSPFLYRDLLIMHFDGSDHQYIVAMNKRTGETVWQTERTVDFADEDPNTGLPHRQGDFRKAFSTPVITYVDDRPILISLGAKALYGYNPETGEELWRVDNLRCHSGACRPVAGHGLVFAPMGSGSELLAVRPDGSGDVTKTHLAWTYKRAVPRRPSPLLVDGLLFMVNDDGVAACVEAISGKEVWRKRLGGNYSASPIYASGRIYFFDEGGKATVIESSRRFHVLATNQLDDGFMASPAVSGDALYLRTRSHLYRIEN